LVLRGEKSAYEIMRLMYQAFNDEQFNFWDDFFDYAHNGFVYISPTAMCFAKACRDDEGDYLFVRAAVGPLCECLAQIPKYLPRIAFCRNNDGQVRMYKTERLVRLAVAQLEKKGK